MKTIPIPIPIPIVPRGFRFLEQDYGNINGEKLISLITSKKFSTALKFIESKSILAIEDEIDFTCIDAEGNTALHLAVKSNKLKLVKAIVEMGGNLYAMNFSLKTPLDLSKEIGFSPIKEYLEQTIMKESEIEKAMLKSLPELEDSGIDGFFFSMQFDPVISPKAHQELTRVAPVLSLPKQQAWQAESFDDEMREYFSSLESMSSSSSSGIIVQESSKFSSSSGSAPIDIIASASKKVTLSEDSHLLCRDFNFDKHAPAYEDIESLRFEVGSIPKHDRVVIPLPKKTEVVIQEIPQVKESVVLEKTPLWPCSYSEELMFSFDDEEYISGVSSSGDLDYE
jgi:hypothetical protein